VPAERSEDIVNNDYRYEQMGARSTVGVANRYLTDAFTWMFLALLLSGAIAWFVENNTDFALSVIDLRIPLFIAQIGLGLGLQWGIRRLNASLALGLFFVYAALMGLTIGVWVWYYGTYNGNPMAVAQAFVSAAAAFGGAAIYGIVTKRSLAGIGSYMFMAAWGIFFAFLINGVILHSSGLDLILSIVGVVVFTVLAAVTTQRISSGQYAAMTGSMEKASVIGAMLLYIEFVNIFLMLLRIFGGGGRR
jgi:uncharacterized protein